MAQELIHHPEGVRDLYGTEFAQRSCIRHTILNQMHRYGYEGIQLPTFEYSGVFTADMNASDERNLYRFFDKEGNTLVLRPDFTPSVARCVSKYFLEDQGSVRLCYQGSVFNNTLRHQGKLRESTQMGAELMNEPSVYGDAEMIALLIKSLLSSGLTAFQVSVGNTDFFRGICESVNMDGETEEELRMQIAGKNFFAAEKLLSEKEIPTQFSELLLHVSDYIGDVEVLKKAREQVNNERSVAAIDRLLQLQDVLSQYGVSEYVTYDLSLLNHYNYYTGVIFRAYTYQVGEAIAKGGRYDNLLDRFDAHAPAVGFEISLDELMNALVRQHCPLPETKETVTISFTPENFSEKLTNAEALRAQGKAVRLVPAAEEGVQHAE